VTERRKVPPVEAWKAIDEMASQQEAPRGERGGAQGPSWPSAPPRPRRMRWVALSVTAAIAAALVAMFAMTGPKLVPTSNPQSSVPDTGDAAPERETMPQRRAAQLRDEAYKACEKAQWAGCLQKLNEAKALDPAGDANPRVRGWRGTAERRATWDAG
jgi:hypothetical protein